MPSLSTAELTPLFFAVSKEEEAEEAERVNALLQRKNLLRDMGVVDQVYRLLQDAQLRPDPTKHTHEEVNVSLHIIYKGVRTSGR